MPRMSAAKRDAFVSAVHEVLDELEHPEVPRRHGNFWGDVAFAVVLQDGVIQDVTVTITERRKPLKSPAPPAASLSLRRAG
jgi:hypothetical protein